MDQNYKDDFFGDQNYEGKPEDDAAPAKPVKQGKVAYVRVPIEYIIVVSIITLVVVIIAYAIGVEHGKNQIGFSESSSEMKESDVNIPDTKIMAEPKEASGASSAGNLPASGSSTAMSGPMMEYTETMKVPESKIDASQTVVTQEEEMADLPIIKVEEKKQELQSAATTGTGKYTVQLMSLKKEAPAKTEVEKLKKAGKNAAYSKKGEWYQVYLQGYRTAEEANKAKKEASGKYPDCYVRRQI